MHVTTDGKTYKGYAFRTMPPGPARRPLDPPTPGFSGMQRALVGSSRSPFTGVTSDGTVEPGLFPVQASGASTDAMVTAAEAFLATLTAEQALAVSFPIDGAEWRQWWNINPFVARHGLLLEELTDVQRGAALAMIRTGMSANGFEAARNMMRVNENLVEITGRKDDFGEWLYWVSIMGVPSRTSPWGWQLDGHHLNVNYFVMGDQVVMSPVFMGAEPLVIETGKYRNDGIEVFRAEELQGLEFARSLDSGQRSKAVLFNSALPRDLPPERINGFDNHVCAGAMNDNVVLPYEGIAIEDLAPQQRDRLLQLTEVYIGQKNPAHALVKMDQIRRQGGLRFAWIGGLGDDDIFYYRIHSPVVLIEFDHHPGYAFVNEDPYKMHIHTMVRTPNGGDYGKALLAQYQDKAQPE